jgi:subtilisin family serine protease
MFRIKIYYYSFILLILGNIAISSDYYWQFGHRTLAEVDTIISIKFDPLMPSEFSETFAYQIEALDESYPPEPLYMEFDVYHVESGHNIDSLLQVLNDRTDVMFAYPVYKLNDLTVIKLNDHFLVKYNDTVTQSAVDSIQDIYHVETIRGANQYTGMRVLAVTTESPGNCLEVADQFYLSGLVKYAHPDFTFVKLHGYVPNDPLYHFQYYLHNDGSFGGQVGIDIGAEKAWEITKGDSNIVVAIIDMGCVWDHEDYNQDNYLGGYDFVGESVKYPAPDEDPAPGDEPAHGVACQGIIFGNIDNGIGISGIAPNCKLLTYKCWDDVGSGQPGPAGVSDFHDAIIQASMADIVSCSWGYGVDTGPFLPEISDALEVANNANTIFVFSSGNYGADYPFGHSVSFPADQDNVIAVGAIERDGEQWLYSGSGPSLNVVAPSGDIHLYSADFYTLDQMASKGWNPRYRTCDSTDNDYICFFGGTSAAAPQVAGILALVKSRRPDIRSIDTLMRIIDSSAVDGIGNYLDKPGWDSAYGYGLVNALRALLAVSRGDANNDKTIDLLDVLYLISYKFQSGPPPVPDVLMGDANCDAVVSILDIFYLISYLNKGGAAPGLCFKYGA